MSLLVEKNGLLDTIQDAGRYGHQHLGVNPGGVMDRVAMRVANALVGNDPGEAVLEMHYPAAQLRFEKNTLIALAGADFSALVNGIPLPLHQPAFVQEGTVLQFGQRKQGARVYLTVEGGFETDEWLQSSSTHLTLGVGGCKGRPLQKADRLVYKKTDLYEASDGDHPLETLPWRANTKTMYHGNMIRFIAGKDWERLSAAAQDLLCHTLFTIGRDSNRMGYRLQGPFLQLKEVKEMISAAVTRGTLQLLPDGQLIVLMADHQTTGGYPVPGHVISADFPSLAQLQAGETFLLRPVTLTEAVLAEKKLEMDLQQLQNACNFRLTAYLH